MAGKPIFESGELQITSCSTVCLDLEPVVVFLTGEPEETILRVTCIAFPVSEIDSELVRLLLRCQVVNLLVPQPVLGCKIPEALLVSLPVTIEIHRTIDPSLNYLLS